MDKSGKFGKILVPEIWAKMFLANEIAGFLNSDFLLVDTNSLKLKVD